MTGTTYEISEHIEYQKNGRVWAEYSFLAYGQLHSSPVLPESSWALPSQLVGESLELELCKCIWSEICFIPRAPQPPPPQQMPGMQPNAGMHQPNAPPQQPMGGNAQMMPGQQPLRPTAAQMQNAIELVKRLKEECKGES